MLRFFVDREISATIGKSQLQNLGKSQANFWFPGNFDSVTGKKTLFPCPFSSNISDQKANHTIHKVFFLLFIFLGKQNFSDRKIKHFL